MELTVESKDGKLFPVFHEFSRAQESHKLHKKKQRESDRKERAVLAELKKEQDAEDSQMWLEIRELQEAHKIERSERKAASSIQDAIDEAEDKAFTEMVQKSIDMEKRSFHVMEESRLRVEAKDAAMVIAKENKRLAIANRTPEENQIAEVKLIANDLFEAKTLENILGPNWFLD
jgi:hypothetical protein